MKIKYKQTKVPHVTNITFNNSQSKSFFRNSQERIGSSEKNKIMTKSELYSPLDYREDSQTQPNQNMLKTCLLLKFNGFIPKNPNVKSVILSCERQLKPIKSLESAKKLQRKFPVRKILTRMPSLSLSMKKDKKFDFANPQTEHLMFQNKEISKSMIRSHSLFYSRKKDGQESVNGTLANRNSTTFCRYDLRNSMGSSTTSLSYREPEQKSDRFRAQKRISYPNI